MASIQRLMNVFVVAERPAELDVFYRSALGLELKFRDENRWIEYSAGSSSVALASREEALPATTGAVMVFEVDDFAGAADRITAAGGEILGTRDMGSHGAVLSLRDPEGNIVQLFKRQRTPTP